MKLKRVKSKNMCFDCAGGVTNEMCDYISELAKKQGLIHCEGHYIYQEDKEEIDEQRENRDRGKENAEDN